MRRIALALLAVTPALFAQAPAAAVAPATPAVAEIEHDTLLAEHAAMMELAVATY